MKPEIAEEFLLSVVGAYVWVSTADEGLSNNEVIKFEHAMMESPFVTQYTMEKIRTYFRDTVQMFEDNFNKAAEVTRQRLQSIANQGMLAEEIVRMSRAAAVGDGALKPPEEQILQAIEKALSLKKGSV